jgi:AraC family transcriptional regulator
MDESIRHAVMRAIVAMQENLGEHLTIDDLARSAMFSKFHFTRIFQRATGLSPGRFLAALRLAEAKRLLVTTPISVADISHQVGYNSVGTFSARFSGSVGVSPTGYRRLRGRPRRVPERPEGAEPGTTVRGQLNCPPGTDFGPVFVGLFPARILEGTPARHVILPAPGPYVLHDVPAGRWHVIVHTIGSGPHEQGPRAHTGISGLLTAGPGITAGIGDVRLHPRHRFDPPRLLALPDLRPVPARRPVAV